MISKWSTPAVCASCADIVQENRLIFIHIKIESFLLLHLRKVCFGKGGGLVPKGNKSLPWPMVTQLPNAHMRPQASMS